MAAKIWLLCSLILIFSSHICTGLKCYACVSNTNVYNSDCNNGTNNVRFGTCPSGYNYCTVKKYDHEDGTTSILRDCATGFETLNGEVGTTGLQGKILTWSRYCQYDLCNSGPYLNQESTTGQSSTASSTTTSQPSTIYSTTTSQPSTIYSTTTSQPSTASYLGGQNMWIYVGLLGTTTYYSVIACISY